MSNFFCSESVILRGLNGDKFVKVLILLFLMDYWFNILLILFVIMRFLLFKWMNFLMILLLILNFWIILLFVLYNLIFLLFCLYIYNCFGDFLERVIIGLVVI